MFAHDVCVLSESKRGEEQSEQSDKAYLIALSIRLSELWMWNGKEERKKEKSQIKSTEIPSFIKLYTNIYAT